MPAACPGSTMRWAAPALVGALPDRALALVNTSDGIVRLTGSDLQDLQSSGLRPLIDATRPRRRSGLV